ncbi:MAG: ribose-5-phosphate isomerase RpiA [Nitrospirales bacterium]|nr:ribose-5-phosphate isomerase RpiA [Nitrospirales bacterium]MBA3966281.1 ribose-5-phosphate isomerase RpiA [Nitrospirales bacterium]
MPSSSTPLTPDQQKAQAAQKALDFIHDGQILGLGTGSTVHHFLTALGQRVQQGLRVRGVPTSQATAVHARQLGIPLLNNEEPWDIDVAVDGADQVDPLLNLIKGGGGALLREKIVAKAARQFIVIVDQAKQVARLGLPFPLPVEIVPFGWRTTQRHLENLGWPSPLRYRAGQPFLTDNGNYVADLHIPEITDPSALESSLSQIPGVVECGLFLMMTSLLITGTNSGPMLTRAS